MDRQRQVTVAPWLEFDDKYLEDWFWHYVYRNVYLKTDFVWVVLNFLAGCMAAMKLHATSAPLWAELLCILSAAIAIAHGLFIWLSPERYIRWRNSIIAMCRVVRIAQAIQLLSSLKNTPAGWLAIGHRLFLLSPAGCNCLFSLAFPLPFRTQLWLQLLTAAMATLSGQNVCRTPDPSPHPPLVDQFTTIQSLCTAMSHFTLKLVPTLSSESPVDTCWPTWAFAVLIYGYLLPCLLLYVREARTRARFMSIVTYQQGLNVAGLSYTLFSLCVSLWLVVLAMVPVLWECILLLYTRALGGASSAMQYDWLALIFTVLVVESGVKAWCFTAMCYVLDVVVRPVLGATTRAVLHGL